MLVSTLYTDFLLLIHHFLTIYAVFQTITISYWVDSITPPLYLMSVMCIQIEISFKI